ncbi:FtsX-like permease family protein [Clostridium sp. N3C]|nr:FtsX-like permease family protein [Clostridium sp. N3C]
MSYLELRKREFGIRFAMGSDKSSLLKLVVGEILIVFLFSDLLALMVIFIIQLLPLNINLPNMSFMSISLSILLAALLTILTSIVPIRMILSTKPVELISGNK